MRGDWRAQGVAMRLSSRPGELQWLVILGRLQATGLQARHAKRASQKGGVSRTLVSSGEIK
jgi:hypothetical protein